MSEHACVQYGRTCMFVHVYVYKHLLVFVTLSSSLMRAQDWVETSELSDLDIVL